MNKTKNYEQFKTIRSNREVDNRHVLALVKSIQEKNLLHLNPIIVNESLEVIDGQHRLEAARLLNTDIYYVIDGEIKEADISKLNSVKKNWSVLDYVNYFATTGKPEFKEVLNFIAKYPGIKLTTIFALLSSDERGSYAKAARSGYVDISNLKVAYKVADMLVELYNLPGKEFVFDSKFGIALMKCTKDSSFDFATLMEKITMLQRRFVKCPTIKEYLEMIEEIYNYKNSKNIIKLT